MMGGAVSSGESNDDLIDNLRGADYIKTPLVEQIFRAVDRAFYYTKPYKQNAYKDMAWKDGNLHLSAPCIYSEVMENLQLKPGMSFLNIGSGTGYVSTMAGLMLGHNGSNHGIELYEDVTEYARAKLQVFLKSSSAVDLFDFCEPQFIVGNCFETLPSPHRYDRIYCGAACENVDLETIIDLLKLGGICVVPINESLVRMVRVSESRVEMKTLLPVSFTTLVPSKNSAKKIVPLPEWNPPMLTELCRAEIRGILRQTLTSGKTASTDVDMGDENRKKRRRRRNDRRRANRLLLVQNRRNGDGRAEGPPNRLIALAYSGSSQDSSDDDRERTRSRGSPLEIATRRSSGAEVPRSQSGSSVQETVSSTASANLDSASPLNEVSDKGTAGTTQGNGLSSCDDCSSQQQLRQTRSAMILGRIRDLVRNRQMEREALLSIQAQRASQLLREVEEALREPPEHERGIVACSMDEENASDNLGNDDDEVDQECVWSSNDSSSSTSSTTSSSTSSSDSDHDSFMVEVDKEKTDSSKMKSEVVDVVESRPNEDAHKRHSPVLGISFTNSRANPDSKDDDATIPNSKKEIKSDMNNHDLVPVFHPFSLQMMEKINLLPLPPALKKYLNYHRKM